ncbi:hypothetical protein [Undibacterium curvum]|nr:hypothetical protein [Undibacterium curvum]
MAEPHFEDDEEEKPQFGRLLIVLFLAVLTVVAITVASEAFYSH